MSEREFVVINEEAARTAQNMMSFNEYQLGSRTKEYQEDVNEVYDLAECEKYFHDKYPVRENRSVEVGKTYRHFKGKIVEVIAISQDTESPGQYYVVYKCEDGAIWSRPYGMFVGKVDRKKYPDADQEYRFEEVQNGHQE